MEYIIFFSKKGDEYLVRFPSSFAFSGYGALRTSRRRDS